MKAGSRRLAGFGNCCAAIPQQNQNGCLSLPFWVYTVWSAGFQAAFALLFGAAGWKPALRKDNRQRTGRKTGTCYSLLFFEKAAVSLDFSTCYREFF
jgi:hypothetical protein